jgi:hypothetical protein
MPGVRAALKYCVDAETLSHGRRYLACDSDLRIHCQPKENNIG